jgi:8-oxo-dGTP pyrophosphatase MutT (NUDIX family)/GNAT superfamily N-acetyltransferase
LVDPLAAAVDRYEPRNAEEAAHHARLRNLAARRDPWSRAEPVHVTASALIVHPSTRRVLLRWHERMRRWMQVGGHGDPGERDPWEVARREAREETGLDDLGALTPDGERLPVQVVIVPVPAHGAEPAHEHADVRYLLSTRHPERARAETPGARLRWLPIDDAFAVVEDNVRVLLQRARDAFDRLHASGAPSLRDAAPHDAADLARLLTQLGYPTTSSRVTAVMPAATGERGGIVVAEDANGLAGFVSYQIVYFLEDAAPRCRVTAIAVDEEARRSGVGRSMLAEVERRARSFGCTEIEVSSSRRPERDGAHRFYPAVGFDDASSASAFYSKPLDF